MDSCTAEATRPGLQMLLSFTEAWLKKAGIQPNIQYDVLIIVEELAVNIVHYAYDGTPGQMVLTLECTPDQSLLRLTLSDRGKPFNPLTYGDPELSESAEERPIGGLGIFMVKNLTSKFDYTYCDKQNKITIEKRLT